MEMQQTHLDRTEKFAEWLEDRRQKLGVSRQDLYRARVISESTYSKFVTIGNTRKKHGDAFAYSQVPKDQSAVMVKVLKYLERASQQSGLVAEGLSIWGLHQEEAAMDERADYMGRITLRLATLPPGDLRMIDELISRFASA